MTVTTQRMLLRVVLEPFREGADVHYMTKDRVSTVTICGASRGEDNPRAFRRSTRVATCFVCKSIRLASYASWSVE